MVDKVKNLEAWITAIVSAKEAIDDLLVKNDVFGSGDLEHFAKIQTSLNLKLLSKQRELTEELQYVD